MFSLIGYVDINDLCWNVRIRFLNNLGEVKGPLKAFRAESLRIRVGFLINLRDVDLRLKASLTLTRLFDRS